MEGLLITVKKHRDTKQVDAEHVVNEQPDFPPEGAQSRRVDMSRITIFMLGHAHIDLGYRWDYCETVHRIAPWTFRGVLDLMERVEGLTFCQSQAFLYQAMERDYPHIFSEIKRRINKRQWEFIGGSWCEYDTILPGGESVIRQHLQGVRYAEDCLGVTDSRIVFVPDCFCGHAASLPQILSGCGFEYYLFRRGLPQDPDHPENTKRSFVWMGRDGSNLIAYLPFGPYSTPPLTDDLLATYQPFIQTAVDHRELVLYGVGDHGGGPRDEDIRALEALQDIPETPAWSYGTAIQFFDTVFDAAKRKSLNTYSGNLGDSSRMTGALTSQARIKRQNRILERLLLSTESLAMICAILQRKPAYPRIDFQELWREFLTHQFHDVLPGTSVASVYRDVSQSYQEIAKKLQDILADAVTRIGSRLDTRGQGNALLVCNPRLHQALSLVTTELPRHIEAGESNLTLERADGTPVEAEIENNTIQFMAELPSLGYEMFRLKQGVAPPVNTQRIPSIQNGVLETGRYKLTFNIETGDLLSALDSQNHRQLFRANSNALLLIEEDACATSWREAFTDTRERLQLVHPPTIAEQNRFFTRITTTSKSRFSTFTREIKLYRDCNRIDFRIVLDWQESSAFLKIVFAPALHDPEVISSLAFGSVPVSNPACDFCTHEYALLRDKKNAMAFFNDGCYAANFNHGIFGLSVVRNARDMDPDMDHGTHELRYALVPFDRGVKESTLVGEHENFLAAFACRWESSHPGSLASFGGPGLLEALPGKKSFVTVDAPNVSPCAFKIPEEEWTPKGFVVRVRETDGIRTSCSVTLPLPIASAGLTDHLERPRNQSLEVIENNVMLKLNPFEIVTFVALI
ncbi:alpha-mannosidase [Verrucomicrobiota bacterium]